MRLLKQCPTCGKNLDLIERVQVGSEILNSYKCGHLFSQAAIEQVDQIETVGCNPSKKLRPYQETTVRFLLDADANGICGHQQRLGKTPSALMVCKNRPDLTPVLVLVRGANLYQWCVEIRNWTTDSLNAVFPIIGSTGLIPPGFQFYVMSMDTLAKKSILDKLRILGIKLVIADECHSFKNPESARSKALVNLFTELNIDHKLLLSGTPIKNRADEWYIPLNLVDPARFPSIERFRRRWLEQDDKGRWSRISRWQRDDFMEAIGKYFIRYEKEDVYTDLPPINRMFTIIEIESEVYKKLYNAVLDEIREKVENGEGSYQSIQPNLMHLRRIAALAKVDWAADYAQVELETSDTSRLAIGIHHKAVADGLISKIGTQNCIKLSGADSPAQKFDTMSRFQNSAERCLVMNMIAGGVGMDFHYCHEVLVLERQWSFADENQFEFRFYNPDKSIMGDNQTNIEYVMARGTVDEFFHEMCYDKEGNFKDSVNSQEPFANDPSLFANFLERTLEGRL
jgi:SNF2 family DNA or RNA helicase